MVVQKAANRLPREAPDARGLRARLGLGLEARVIAGVVEIPAQDRVLSGQCRDLRVKARDLPAERVERVLEYLPVGAQQISREVSESFASLFVGPEVRRLLDVVEHSFSAVAARVGLRRRQYLQLFAIFLHHVDALVLDRGPLHRDGAWIRIHGVLPAAPGARVDDLLHASGRYHRLRDSG